MRFIYLFINRSSAVADRTRDALCEFI